MKVQPLLDRVGEWMEFVRLADDAPTQEALRLHERTGRPLWSEKFIAKLERLAGRMLRKRKPGPKKRKEG